MKSVSETAGNGVAAEIECRVQMRFTLTVAELAARVREIGRDPASLCLDDLYLAMACAAGDEHAWREFSTRYFEYMRSFARRILPLAAAREVADEVIAELWSRSRLRQYEGRSTLRTWLGAVVTHAALNSRKVASRTVPLEAGQARSRDGTATPFERSGAAEEEEAAGLLREMLTAAVERLTPEERLLLQLYYEQDMTLDQMSAALFVSTAAISRRLKRTRETLREAIEVLSRGRTGEPADSLRAGLDLGRIELDLGKLFGGAV